METDVTIERSGCTLHGSLLLPESHAPVAVVLIHPGSGPTDRNGNSRLGMQSNAYRLLATELCSRDVASLLIDKRGVGKSIIAESEASALSVDDYVNDVLAWLSFLGSRLRCPVCIIGHSEGGLMALLAAQRSAPELAGLVLLSVSSLRYADLILGQLDGKVSDEELHWSRVALSALANGDALENVPTALTPLFNPAVQGYVRSRLSIDPLAVAQDIEVPYTIIAGSADLQVEASDSMRLVDTSAARPFIEIQGMTHTLKQVVSADSDQSEEYTNPALPLAPGLTDGIVGFVRAVS